MNQWGAGDESGGDDDSVNLKMNLRGAGKESGGGDDSVNTMAKWRLYDDDEFSYLLVLSPKTFFESPS